MEATPIEELRKPHPEQKRIDAESAALLRATALQAMRRGQQAILASQPPPAPPRES